MADEKHELTISRTFDASREKVWRAWTDPNELQKWWGPRGVTNSTCEWDATPGGNINIVMLAGASLGNLAGQEWPMRGTFREIVPQEKLVFTSQAIMDGKSILENLVTVTFAEHDGRTELTLHVVVTKVTPEAEGPLAGMQAGWTQSIDKLGELVEGKL